MIFQAGIELEVEGKEVQAIIDMDTGIFGFTEVIDGKDVEYSYFNCPHEYRMALLKRLDPLFSKKSKSNMIICRKGEAAELLRNYFFKDR